MSPQQKKQALFVPQVILHDLTSPLSSLAGVFNLLDWEQVGQENRELLIAGQQALAQALRLINNPPSGMQAARAWRFEPTTICSQLAQSLRGVLTEAKVELQYLPMGNFYLAGEPVIFERMVVNLVMNSLVAMANTPRRHLLRIYFERSAAELVIAVADNGPGFTPRALIAARSSFSRGANGPQQKMTGLGFVKVALSEYFGGRLEIDSSSAGAVVKLIFPS